MKHTMSVMDSSGHTEVCWDVDNEIETLNAANVFARMKSDKCYIGYKTNPDGSSEVIDTFDPNAQSITMSPQLMGG